MKFMRVAAVPALALGIAGMAACLAGAYGVWLAESRLSQANDRVFDAVDRNLEVVQDLMSSVRERVKESKSATLEVAEAVREWGAKKGQDLILSHLQVEGKVEKLSNHLRTAHLRLESSKEAIRDIRQLLDLGQGLGAMMNPGSTGAVQELLASLEDTLQQAEHAADSVRKFTTSADGGSADDRQAEVAKLLAPILPKLTEVDGRLEDVAGRLSEFRTGATEGKAKTSQCIVLGAFVGYGLVAWGMAGQAALCWWGWKRWR